MSETIAGITVPDSPLAAQATELVRDTAGDLLFHHSRRVFLSGSLQGGGSACGLTRSCCTSARCSTTWA